MEAIRMEAKLDHSTLKPLLRGAFTTAPIYRAEFPAGMSLYKITQRDAVSASGTVAVGPSGFATPWWFSYRTLGIRDARIGAVSLRGIADIVESASRTPAGSLQGFLRSRGAVCEDWNQMTHLLIVDLRRPVIGIVGTCSGQPVFHETKIAQKEGVANVRFIGGEQQIYLPGLNPSDVAIRSFGPLP